MDVKSEDCRYSLFIAPGIVEVPNTRGAGIENNIYFLSLNLKHSSIIFSPRPRIKQNVTLNEKTEIKYSFLSAIPKYPLAPHIQLSNLLVSLSLIIFYLQSAFYIIKHKNCINVVIIFNKFFGIIPIFVAWILGVKRIYMEYNIWPWTYSAKHRSIIFAIQVVFGRIVSKFSSHVTANSPSIINGMKQLGIPKRKIELVPTGIESDELSEFKSISKGEPFKVLYAGRLVEERGANLLPLIIQNMIKMNKNIHFRIVGGGILLDSLRYFIHENNLSEFVELYGAIEREEVWNMMRESHVALFISEHENYGSLALLESMALGCPAIATNVGSTSLIINHKNNGYLVDANEQSIVDAILSITKERSTLESASLECVRTAKQYSWENVTKKLDQIIFPIRGV